MWIVWLLEAAWRGKPSVPFFTASNSSFIYLFNTITFFFYVSSLQGVQTCGPEAAMVGTFGRLIGVLSVAGRPPGQGVAGRIV